jgi:hypothetical protein
MRGCIAMLTGRAIMQCCKHVKGPGDTFIAGTFAAVIYGRPTTVGRNFSDLSYPNECDDMEPMHLKTCHNSVNGGKNLLKLTYHTRRYRLYVSKAQIISKVHTIRACASFHASGSGVQGLPEQFRVSTARSKCGKIIFHSFSNNQAGPVVTKIF